MSATFMWGWVAGLATAAVYMFAKGMWILWRIRRRRGE